MPGDITDAAAGDRHDPALIVGDGDPEHRKMSHDTEPAHMLGEPLPKLVADREYPTDEEILTLRRVSDHIPWRAYIIGFVELVERMSYYGTTQVFVNFIQKPNPGTSTGRAVDPSASDAKPGALGFGQRASTGLTTFNQFWVYTVPLFGAYVADTYTGRFRAIWMSVVIATIGHIILTSSAAPSVIAHPNSAMAAFIIGLIIMGIGTGGFKPNISPLVAEQIPHSKRFIKTIMKKGGKSERVIVDPEVTILRVYNWFYLFINIGALIGQVSMVYAERYVGFYLSFLIPTICFALTLPILYFSRHNYNRTPPEGSVLLPAVKLLFTAAKGRWHINPVATYRHMNDGTFWEAVKPSNIDPAHRRKWMTFNDVWVEEVARGFAACTVFCWLPLYWLTYNQINNNLTSQANVMALHGVPNDVISNLDPFALIILIPIFDFFIYPGLRRIGINFTPIKRITAGFMLGGMAMIWAAVIQVYIYRRSVCGNNAAGEQADGTPCPNVDINVWAQTGSYILIAISEIFASITALEYAFTKAPKNMRSLVMAFNLFSSAVAAAIGEAFVSVSADPLLVWNYGSMAVIAFIGGILFYFTFRSLDKREDVLNAIPAGNIHHEGDPHDVEHHTNGASVDIPEKKLG